ncbi:MAG: hypothetical protein ACK4N1_10125 [Pseudorhizobium sp.]
MSEYPFSEREQDAIRELGKAGFRYVRETKKAVEFTNELGQFIELNREHSEIALVFGFGVASDCASIQHVNGTGTRASSNFRGLDQSLTKNGKSNHQGQQVVVDHRSAIQIVVETMMKSGKVSA